jgi:uncharacterized protein YjbI with pentapeptide repeats
MTHVAPITRIAFTIIDQAIERGASEIHVEPMADKMVVRYEIAGTLQQVIALPKHIHAPLVLRYKTLRRMSLLNWLHPRRRHYAFCFEEREYDLWVKFLPTPLGDKVVVHVAGAGWKSGWRRRQRHLEDASARWLHSCGRTLWQRALDLPRLTVAVMSVVSAQLGLPFGRRWPYWKARYWGIDANLSGVQLPGAALRRANLSCAILNGARLSRASLAGAALQYAYLIGADLRGADLAGAYLISASLENADLRHADLREARLNGANIQGAMLQGANLRGADLSSGSCRIWVDGTGWSADGCATDLRGADLSDADLTGAYYDMSTRWPDDFDPQQHGAVGARSTRTNAPQ